MPYELHQIAICCGNCGNYLYRAHRNVINLDASSATSNQDKDFMAICQHCNAREFILILKNAEKIILLPREIHTRVSVADAPEPVKKMSGRREVVPEEIDEMLNDVDDDARPTSPTGS